MATLTTEYPVQLTVDYPDRPLDRLTTAFRIFTVIPIAIVLGALSGGSSGSSGEGSHLNLGGTGFLFLAPVLLIVFRQKYPRWWFDWNLALARFGARVGAYLMLLTDQYPSTDEEQVVHLQIPYPNASGDLNRWLPLVKWFLAIPHYVVLLFLGIAALFVWVVAWFAILFTGRYPRSLFAFVVGVVRWPAPNPLREPARRTHRHRVRRGGRPHRPPHRPYRVTCPEPHGGQAQLTRLLSALPTHETAPALLRGLRPAQTNGLSTKSCPSSRRGRA